MTYSKNLSRNASELHSGISLCLYVLDAQLVDLAPRGRIRPRSPISAAFNPFARELACDSSDFFHSERRIKY